MKILLFSLSLLATVVRGDTVLGKIGEIELTTSGAREALAGLQASTDTTLAKDPAAVGQYVRALLIQRLVLKQAADQKFDGDPAVIAKLVRARETALAEAFLEANSTPPEGYPSEDELKAAYEAAKPSLLLPKAWNLSQIYVKGEAKRDAVQKALAAKGADFAAVAKESSEDKASAVNGGTIGWLAEAQLQPAIAGKVLSLAKGQTSPAIQLNDGWHFIKVTDIRDAATASFPDVREQLVLRLRSDRSKQLRAEFIGRLLKDHPLAINEIELSKILSAP